VPFFAPLHEGGSFATLRPGSRMKADHDITFQATQSVVRTMLDMLFAGVALSDVQVLADPEDGKILFIDMTEAKIFESPEPSTLDLQYTRSFLSETLALVQRAVLADVLSQPELDALVETEVRAKLAAVENENNNNNNNENELKNAKLVQLLTEDFLSQ
jgi:hypothetical protein